jgi:hypothetical protein
VRNRSTALSSPINTTATASNGTAYPFARGRSDNPSNEDSVLSVTGAAYRPLTDR